MVVSVTYSCSLCSHIHSHPSVSLPSNYKIYAAPLLRHGVLPCLLVDVSLLKPCVTHSCLMRREEGQQLSTSFIGYSISVRAPHTCPLLITLPGSNTGIEVSQKNILSSDGTEEMMLSSSWKKASLFSLLAALVGA